MKKQYCSESRIESNNDGTLIRIPIPALNEEKKEGKVKLVKKFAEDGKVAVKKYQKRFNRAFKKTEKKSIFPKMKEKAREAGSTEAYG